MSDDEDELRALRAQRAQRGEGASKPLPPVRHHIFVAPSAAPQQADGVKSDAAAPVDPEDDEAAALRAFLPVTFGKEKFRHQNQKVPKDGGTEEAAGAPPTGTAGVDVVDVPNADQEKTEEERQAAAAAVEIDEYQLPISNEAILSGHVKSVTALAVDPAGSRFVTGSSDYTVRVYDFGGMKSDLKSFRELEPHDGHPVHVLSWSPTGDAFLAITGAATAKIYTRDGTALGEAARGDMYIRDPKNTKGHISALMGGAWHPTDRTTVMTCSEDGTIRLWDAGEGMKQKTVIKPTLAKQQRTAVTSCAWNADGHMFAAGLRDGSIQLWSMKDKHFGTSAATPLVPVPKQQMIAKQDWSYVGRPDKLMRPAHEAGADITGLAFNQAGTSLASRSSDGTLKVWDVRRLTTAVHTWDEMPTAGASTAVAWSPDQRLLITGSSSGQAEEAGAVSFFDVTKGTLVRRVGMPGSVTALAWHPRINQIFAGIGNRKSGSTHILYDPQTSVRGVTGAVRRAPRRPDPLDYQPPLLIRAPHALPMFREDPTRRRPQRGRDEPDPKKVRMPARGNAVPGVGAQGRIGTTGGTLLTQHILRQKGKLVGVDEELDPREAILRHEPMVASDPRFMAYTAAYAKTQPEAIYQEDESHLDHSDEDDDEGGGGGK